MSGSYDTARRRPTLMMSAIVHIQIYWRNKVALIRARAERAKELEDEIAKEQRAFSSLAPTRKPSRTSRDLEMYKQRTASANIIVGTARNNVPQASPRYLRRDSDMSSPSVGEDLCVSPTQRHVESRRGVGALHLQQDPIPPHQQKQHATTTTKIMSVDAAANTIKFFMRARILLWRLREQRQAREKSFLLWEAAAFRLHGSSSRERRRAARRPEEVQRAPQVVEASGGPRQCECDVHQQELEMLLEQLLTLKNAVSNNLHHNGPPAAAASSRQQHCDTFKELQHSVRQVLEAAQTSNSVDVDGSPPPQFELLADSATDLCVDIQSLLEANLPPRELTIDEVHQNINASAANPAEDDTHSIAIQQAAAEIADAESRVRAELHGQYVAKGTILLESFYDGRASWLLSAEADARTSAVTRSEAAARRVMEDIREITERHLHARNNAVITLQCWTRCVCAKRVYRTTSQRCARVLLQRIAAENADNNVEGLGGQDEQSTNAIIACPQEGNTAVGNSCDQAESQLNASVSAQLNILQQSMAATSIQRVVRGHQARGRVKLLVGRLKTFLLGSQESLESRRDQAAATIVSFFRSFTAQRRIAVKRCTVALLLHREDIADRMLEELFEYCKSAMAAPLVASKLNTHVVAVPQTNDGDDVTNDVHHGDGAAEGTVSADHVVRPTKDATDALQEVLTPAPPPQTTGVGVRQPPRPHQFSAVSQAAGMGNVQEAPVHPAATGGATQRPMSARVPSTFRAQPPSRRPTTASTRKKPSIADGSTPYVDGCHDSKTALRAISASPLCTLPTDARPQALHGRLVTGDLQSSPNDIVDDDEDDDEDGADSDLVSPVRWRDSVGTAEQHQVVTSYDERPREQNYSRPPPLSVSATRTTAKRRQVPEYLNYVGMLDTLKATILNGVGLSADQRASMMHCDLLDVIFARRGSVSPKELSKPKAPRQSLTVFELDAPLIRSPVAGGGNILELRQTQELSDLWMSDVFIDRVAQRLSTLTPPSERIEQYSFCLDEISIAILSSIDTIAATPLTLDDEVRDADGVQQSLPPFVAKTQLIDGVPAMMLYQGQPVADREEFEIFCEVFVSTCKLLAEERRTVDSATISSCFTILDVRRRRILPRELFESVFKLRVPLGANHHGGVPFLAFASALRRNMIHTPMTCQKLMGTFFEKQLLSGNVKAIEKRHEVICHAEEQLRMLSSDILESIGSVGEQAGASLGDSLVLYTALLQPSASAHIRWFALSLMATLYNHFNVQAMKGFAALPQLVKELQGHLSTDACTEESAKEGDGKRTEDEVWEDILRAFALFVDASVFSDSLRVQKQCDGAAARRNAYRVRVSNSEELDRCVPWSTLSLPCVDSLNYFAAQRVSFDGDLTKRLTLDSEGHIVRCCGPATRQENGGNDGKEWISISNNSKARFFCTSASAHVAGFDARRRQWNDLLYSLRHYAICLSDIFALQYMDRSMAHLPSPMHRATSAIEAQRQLMRSLALHPDFLPSFPLRRAQDGRQSNIHRGPTLFTNRFARMLFTLSVQEKQCASRYMSRPWAAAPLPRCESHGDRTPTMLQKSSLLPPPGAVRGSPDAPLDDRPSSSRALHQYATSVGSPLSSRPGSASSMSSANNPASRPTATDLCSPPSRQVVKPIVHHQPPPPKTVSATHLSTVPPENTSVLQTERGCSSSPLSSPPKRTTVMEQIMGSFRGIPTIASTNTLSTQPSSASSSSVQHERGPKSKSMFLPPAATTVASNAAKGMAAPPMIPQEQQPGCIGGGQAHVHVAFTPEAAVASSPPGKQTVLLTQRVASMLAQSGGNSTRPSPPRGGVYPAFRNTRGSGPPSKPSAA